MSFVYKYARKSYIYEAGFSLNNLEPPKINEEEIKQEPSSTCYFFQIYFEPHPRKNKHIFLFSDSSSNQLFFVPSAHFIRSKI